MKSKRYENALTTVLERVVDNGLAYITWRELYRWFDVKRIDKNIWEDIRTRFAEVIEDDDIPLMVLEDGHGFTLINGDENRFFDIETKFASRASRGD